MTQIHHGGGSTVRWLVAVSVVLIGVVLTAAFFDAIKIVFLGTVGPLLIAIGLVMTAVAKE
jgi:hypothetical protein